MAILFRDKVFSMLIQGGKTSEDLVSKVCEWSHSGFNIHNEVQIDAYLKSMRKKRAELIKPVYEKSIEEVLQYHLMI